MAFNEHFLYASQSAKHLAYRISFTHNYTKKFLLLTV